MTALGTGARVGRRTVLVTGGSAGIGYAMASALAATGARVGIVSRRNPDLWEEGPPPSWNPDRDWIRADLADAPQAVRGIEAWLDRIGDGLDAVVASAVDYASPRRHPFEETTAEEWRVLFDTNVNGVFLVLKAALPRLLQRDVGLVVGVTSDIAFAPGPHRIGYAATKAAVRAIFDGLAAEMAGRNVNVVQLLPARQVATPGLRRRRPPGFDFTGYLAPTAFAAPVRSLMNGLGAGLNGRVLTVDDEHTQSLEVVPS